MTLTKQRASFDRRGVRSKRFGSSEGRGVRLTKAGGWIALVFGAVHVIVAPLENRSRDLWSQVVNEGWWNTFTLDEPTTLAEFDRAERFWVTLGSWGVPLLVLGAYIVWSTYQRPPRARLDRLDQHCLGADPRDCAAPVARLAASHHRRPDRSRRQTENPSHTATYWTRVMVGQRSRLRYSRCTAPRWLPIGARWLE
jgi:hypothetical protein